MSLLQRGFSAACVGLFLLNMPGCANRGIGQPRAMSGARTTTTIGDRPETVVAGTPGRSQSSGPLIVDGPSRSDGRISGRVVDDKGRPIANAEVRLADGSASSGRVVRTLTDDLGAFTLSGLRSGRSYTLIAHGDQAGRAVSGREVVDAPASRVEIGVVDEATRAASAERRVDRVSSRDEYEDAEDDLFGESKPARRGTLNEDDLPGGSERFDEEPSRGRSGTPSWHAASAAPLESDHRSEGATPFVSGGELSASGDAEGENPLPPALERRPETVATPAAPRDLEASPARSTRPSTESASTEPFTSGEGPLVAPAPMSPPAQVVVPNEAQAPRIEPAPEGSGPVPARSVEGPSTPADFPTPEPVGTSASQNASPAIDQASPVAEPVPNSPTLAPPGGDAASEATSPADLPASESSEPDAQVMIDGPKRPTWKELAAQSETTPPVMPTRSIRRTAARSPVDVAVAQLAHKPRAPIRAECRYNARERRIVDFQLADLDGGAVRLSDLEADYILLDFWGTWCPPCLKAIPHLVELQTRYDPNHVRVVGIAYETSAPEERAASVRRVAEQLGVNYELLLAEADGQPCPLAAALNVGAYPTMILLDRNGRVLWRDSGANDATLARLDRVVATNARGTTETVRR